MAISLHRTDRGNDLLTQMRREMNDLMSRWMEPTLAASLPLTDGIFATCEMQETDSEFLVRLDLPGVPEKDVKLAYQHDALTVSGERREEKTETKGSTRYSERRFGAFSRTIVLPAPVKVDQIRARMKNGVMEVHLPKEQKTPSREIKIENGE